MALIQCESCGKLISDKASKCPKCNTKIQKNKLKDVSVINVKNKKQMLKKIVPFFFVVFIGLLYYFVLSVPSLEKIKDSVVKIEAYDKDNNLLATGSGFCAFKSNYIITNFHVIEGAYSLKVVDDNKDSHDVNNIIIFDYKNDLTILDSDIDLKPLKINNGKIKTGQNVTAIGSPLGELNTVSTGIVSNAENDKGIQISAAISHGSSGGALFNSRHELIGITYAGYDEGQNLNFAISTNYLNELYDAFKTDNYHIINHSNYNDCIASKEGFTGCWLINNNFYSVSSIDIMYDISNIKAVYEKNLQYEFKILYDNYSKEEQELVISTYQELLKYNDCQYYYTCDVKSKLKKWDINEFFIYLGVLSREDLAFVLVDLKNYNSKDSQFERVNNKYPLGAAEKSLILYLLGNYKWNDIHKDNKEDIFDYFDEKLGTFDVNNFGSVLELLGYEVKYHKDGTLTAYWK